MIQPTFTYRMRYFDRDIIRRDWSRVNRSPLQHAGMLVRKIARQSIKVVPPEKNLKKPLTSKQKRKRAAPSPPGKPPKSRYPGQPLRRIYSLPMPRGDSVMIGAIHLEKPRRGEQPVPGLHEHGGRALRFLLIADPRRLPGGTARRGHARTLKKRHVTYPPRPFMAPALEKAAPKIPEFWKHSLTAARK